LVLGRTRAAALFAAFAAAALIAPASASAINQVSFSEVGAMTTARDAPGVARLHDGKVLLAGGCTTGPGNCALTSAELFDPASSTFSSAGLGTMAERRWGPAAATLPDGRVLVAGGWNGVDDVATAEVFNPNTKTFSPVGNMLVPREEPGVGVLPDGRVLIVAGYSNTDPVDSSEIFDPKTNTFSAGPNFPDARYGIASAVISGGRILFAGGYNTNEFSSAFVFNPSTNSFGPVGSLPEGRYAPAGASLPGGRALVAGGDDGVTGDLTSALIFDPASNSFSSAGIGPLSHKREEAGAVELADGRVLVAGGYDRSVSSELQTAEVLSVPSNSFKAKLNGRKIIFTVSNEGVASAADSSTKFATTAKKKKKPKLVKTTSKHGGPGKIKVKVKLTKAGSAKLAEKGKLTIKAVYTPDGGLAAVKKLTLR
jgi:hypothetical protein